MKLEPRNDFVIVELWPAETKSKGGILLPENSAKKSQKATVRAVGPKVTDLKIGNVVLIQQFSGEQVDGSNDNWRAVREDSIVCTLV